MLLFPSLTVVPVSLGGAEQVQQRRRSLICLPKPGAAPWQSRGRGEGGPWLSSNWPYSHYIQYTLCVFTKHMYSWDWTPYNGLTPCDVYVCGNIHSRVCVCVCVSSVRYEDPGAVEGLAGALDTRLQVTGAVNPRVSASNHVLPHYLCQSVSLYVSVKVPLRVFALYLTIGLPINQW